MDICKEKYHKRTSISFKTNIRIESYQLFHKTHGDHKNQHHISLKQKNMSPTRKGLCKFTASTQYQKEEFIIDTGIISLQVAFDDLSTQDSLLKQSWQLLCH